MLEPECYDGWYFIDIRPGEFSDAYEMALAGGEENIGYNVCSWIAVRDDILAVQIKLAFG
jgi:hypothetical protein